VAHLWLPALDGFAAPRPLVAELAKIRSGDVVLPTKARAAESQRLVRLRCVTEPDAAQKMLLARLGVKLPPRLRQQAPVDAV
jgi:hypothetical protein